MANAVFSAWQLRIRSQAEFDELARERVAGPGDAPRDQLLYLLRYSLLAPSSHNSVPQLYRVDAAARAVDVLLDRGRVLPASDPTGKQALIGIGCAVENLDVAARAHGLELEWLGNPALLRLPLDASASPHHLWLGRATFRAAPSGTVLLDDGERLLLLRSLVERRTVRSEFDPAQPLPDHLAAALQSAAAQSPGVVLRLFSTASDRFNWGKLDELATKNKLEQAPFRTELGRWLLPNDERSTPRGMRGREFGLGDAHTLELGAQLRGEQPLATDQLALLARGGRVLMQSAAAIAALAADDTVPLAIEVGRVFQRCALLAWRGGFAHAVHTAICEVPHVRSMCRATLLPGTPGPGLVFRLGVPLASSDWDRPHSSRPELADLLVPELPPASEACAATQSLPAPAKAGTVVAS